MPVTDPLAAEARRLRVDEQLSVAEIRARLGISRDRVYALLRGIPPPEWTRRPRARDDARAEALRLRAVGRSVDEIAVRLGVAKSTAYRWVGHIPLDASSDAAAQRRRAAGARRALVWAGKRTLREAAECEARRRAADWVGALASRELLLVGAVLYMCEGTKSRPANPRYDLTFTNSGIRLVELFVRFVETRPGEAAMS
ncbi:Homeodomain-like domain-containing protein [Micromonospora marina]|uniref:Homeodomain-like domain-containing protein n=1 Tax=Micromonospora marina TaxID=307120 RepID=A0A1C5A1G8_9ACTN|nr:Homeodomain-like domain-containing protein [Micromonospora marina]